MDKELMYLSFATASNIAVELILHSIKINGLEKTLEDLRSVCPYPLKTKEKNDITQSYRGFLSRIKNYREAYQRER